VRENQCTKEKTKERMFNEADDKMKSAGTRSSASSKPMRGGHLGKETKRKLKLPRGSTLTSKMTLPREDEGRW